MNTNLREDLLRAFVRMRKTTLHFPSYINLHLTELFAMGKIAGSDAEQGTSGTELQQDLRINKSAVSQMLGTLVHKGYIERKTNKNDRRRIVVGITPEGKNAMAAMKKHVNIATTRIIEKFGEERTEMLIHLVNEFVDVFDEVQADMIANKSENSCFEKRED